jgi:hypothetical protein
MDVQLSFAGCFDHNCHSDAAKFLAYRKQNRDENDREEGGVSSEIKLRPFKRRKDYEYDPSDALNSEWYRRYVSVRKSRKTKRYFEKFRRRFRMPHHIFESLLARARAEGWFPTRENVMRVDRLEYRLRF